MGAFWGCIFGALIIAFFIEVNIAPHLKRITEQLKRIADALEGEDDKGDPQK